jgi:diaminopimelate epimerase
MARFLKMHGCGNDFVVFDERARPLGLTPSRAAAIADRRTGVSCDQFIAIEPPPRLQRRCLHAHPQPRRRRGRGLRQRTRCVVDLLAR